MRKNIIFVFALLLLFAFILGCTTQSQQQKQSQQVKQTQGNEQKNQTSGKSLTLEQINAMKKEELNKTDMIKCQVNLKSGSFGGSMNVMMYYNYDKDNGEEKFATSTEILTAKMKFLLLINSSSYSVYTSRDTFLLLMKELPEKLKNCDYFYKIENIKPYSDLFTSLKLSLSSSQQSASQDQQVDIKCEITNLDNSVFEVKGNLCDSKLLEEELNKSSAAGQG
ncbi:MAG: hypothetical protein QXI89_00325 [Candidatus Anstonellales archaeon]